MSAVDSAAPATRGVQVVRFFARFTRGQRWEHWLLFGSFAVLFLTGIVQKYRTEPWSQNILSTPERLVLIQTIHHIAAIVLILEVIYHLGRGIYLLARRKMPHAIFPEWQDVKDAGHMTKYLLFLAKRRPKYGKYSFEEKLTYWFLFFSIGIMVITGLVIWFPIQVTYVLPGSIVLRMTTVVKRPVDASAEPTSAHARRTWSRFSEPSDSNCMKETSPASTPLICPSSEKIRVNDRLG